MLKAQSSNQDWNKPDLQLLIYPLVDLTLSSPSYQRNGEGYLLTREQMHYFRDQYLASIDQRDDWRASPLQAADLTGLPPAFVLTAGALTAFLVYTMLIAMGLGTLADIWAEAEGCSPVGDTPYTTVADGKWGWRCTQHGDCAAGTDVVTCQWDWTHDWGRDGSDNFMWDAVWEFFESHPRR